ncbi:MAG: replication protein DnaD [Paenibacillaceae bacterium]|jgi:DNA replication protein|nr:replication protein DnaD [Paenibacillaceae bacterium]
MNRATDSWQETGAGVLAGLRAGSVPVPMLLLQTYAKLDLTEAEVMLMLQLIAFNEREKKDFPTPDELAERMSLTAERVADTLQKLMEEGFIGIDEETESISGIRFERYNLEGLWQRLAMVWAMESKAPSPPPLPKAPEKLKEPPKENSIYVLFEKEFARLLTPMEMETITGWLDKDRYPLELVHMALKEAVFAGKIHFRYIDRILLDWKRNKVFTPEQAREHTQRFRGAARG